jgi:hypothetical protein
MIEPDISPRIRSFFLEDQQLKSVTAALRKKPHSCLGVYQRSVPGVSRVLSNVQKSRNSSNSGFDLSHSSIFLFKPLIILVQLLLFNSNSIKSVFICCMLQKIASFVTANQLNRFFMRYASATRLATVRTQAFALFERRIRTRLCLPCFPPLCQQVFRTFLLSKLRTKGASFPLRFFDLLG